MSSEMPKKEERKIAFVVVDVQRKFTGGSIPEKGNKEEIETINKVAAMFRNNGRPVIFVHYDGECECSMYEKSDGDEFLHGIVKDPRDMIVHKKHMNSFVETRLAEAVKECGCDSILLAGMVTQYCVMGTYYGAFENGISPYMLVGGLIGTNDKMNDAACVLCKTFTPEEAEENLKTTKVPDSTKMCGSEYQRLPSAGE
ncbi:MAG: isochorismatase family protein [Methanomassiliicoccaceae archaeon]|nr:isochorismatase family protein [Methanomassiliicoccaceae archaeon]